MPKKIFGLSEQTKETLTDNVKAMAAAWDCSTSFLYQILKEEKADVYPPFREFYVSMLRAGISTEQFDSDLEFERDRHAKRIGTADASEYFKDKIHRHNQLLERYVECLTDGEIDDRESAELERLLEKELDAINLIRQALKLKRDRGLKAV